MQCAMHKLDCRFLLICFLFRLNSSYFDLFSLQQNQIHWIKLEFDFAWCASIIYMMEFVIIQRNKIVLQRQDVKGKNLLTQKCMYKIKIDRNVRALKSCEHICIRKNEENSTWNIIIDMEIEIFANCLPIYFV